MKLVSPSFLSSLVSLVGALVVVVGALSPLLYQGSYLEQYGQTVKRYPGNLGEIYSQVAAQLNSNEIVGNITVFCSWAIIGFLLYYLGLMLLSFFINLTTFTNLLGYKNTDKKSLIVGVSERLIIRVVSLVALIAWISFGFYILVPVVLTLIAASYSSPTLIGSFYVLASIVFLFAASHMTVVLLRLVFLRPRLISWMYQASDAQHSA